MVKLVGAYLSEVDLLTSQMKLPCIFFFKKFYLFIFGCAGSLWLYVSFLYLRQAGATFSLWYTDFSHCQAWALGHVGLRHHGSWALEHMGSGLTAHGLSQGIFPARG